jgi:hypothetical protein
MANVSLDQTIDQSIGRKRFEQNLDEFRGIQQLVQDSCENETHSNCNETVRLKMSWQDKVAMRTI